ncbi:unknown [Eubacterium sp. CAG:76]|nr:unknown [Eubacterium sp. CAG:76]
MRLIIKILKNIFEIILVKYSIDFIYRGEYEHFKRRIYNGKI